MADPFRVKRIVEFGETDMAGIVHFATFFRWMESAEHAFLRSRGLSVAGTFNGEKIGFPRVAASCDFIKPVRFEDELTIEVRIDTIGRTSVSYAFDIFKQADLIAKGRITAVLCVDVPGVGLQPREIAGDLRARLEGLDGGALAS